MLVARALRSVQADAFASCQTCADQEVCYNSVTVAAVLFLENTLA
jgi:hypothetical protein